MHKLISKIKLNRGFTLIETFVAITILMIAILGPMSIIAKFYADSTYAKHQIASAFLAQDGMETVQNIIKSNTKDRAGCTGDWLDNLGLCKTTGCNVNSLSGEVNDTFKLYINSNDLYINSVTSKPSIFSRKITISNTAGEPSLDPTDYSSVYRSAQITSEVFWSEKGEDRSTIVSSLIIQSQCLRIE